MYAAVYDSLRRVASDDEVVGLAWALTGEHGSVEAVAVWRRRLAVPAGGNELEEARNQPLSGVTRGGPDGRSYGPVSRVRGMGIS